MNDPAACAATRYANQLHATVERLAIRRRWPLVLSDGNVHLPTGRGIAGLVVSTRIGDQVGVALPVLALSAELRAFLVDTAHGAIPTLPAQVGLVHDGQYLPLPPSVTARGPVRWVREPDDHLPRLLTVLELLRPFLSASPARRTSR